MGTPAENLTLAQFIPVFKLLRHKSLPSSFEDYEQYLYKFVEVFNPQSTDSLRQADEFFIYILNTCGIEEASAIRDIVEMFCEFLESRQYINANPFCQSPPEFTVNPSNPTTNGNRLRDSRKPNGKEINVIPILTHSEPKEPELPLTPKNNTTPLIETGKLNDVKTPPALKKPLKELINDFLDEQSYVGKKRRPSTITTYKTGLKIFANFLEKNHLTLSTESLMQYVKYLEECTTIKKLKSGSNTKEVKVKISSETIMVRRNSLLSFLNYGVKNKWFTISDSYHDILQTSKRERTAKNPHIALTLAEAHQLFNYVITLDSKQEMMEILIPLLSGARAMETVPLKKRNFDLANHRLKLNITKNGLPRDIPLPHFMVIFLELILSNYDFEDYIFPSRQSEAMSEKTLTMHIKNVARLAGLNRTVTCHDLRATFATLQYYYGDGDIIRLQKYMGHKDISTTANYVSSRNEYKQTNTISLDYIYQEWGNALLKQT
jgi:site-specific recombinase XerD